MAEFLCHIVRFADKNDLKNKKRPPPQASAGKRRAGGVAPGPSLARTRLGIPDRLFLLGHPATDSRLLGLLGLFLVQF